MKKQSQSHPRAKWVVRLLIVPALLLAGYAGLQLTPLVHSTSNAAPHLQLADQCAATTGHC